MPLLAPMPRIQIPTAELRVWGQKWLVNQALNKKEGMDFGKVFDKRIGEALAVMLGGIEVTAPSQQALLPASADAVEVGPVRVIGGIRPQNYDVGYRPDGVRFVSDSKTLNDTKSVGKNFQNMVNDLGTEATTVHIRFPYAVVGFVVIIPSPCFTGQTRDRFTRMLDRLVGRSSPIDVPHKAEAMTLVLWNPNDGTIEANWPPVGSPLRIEHFSEQVQAAYHARYDGMAPHDKPSAAQKRAMEEAGEELIEPDQDDGVENDDDDA
ncbi:MAG: hypothetical protein JSS27_05235 [Planctomycetes bacterium]|nr:hypothetical protein [Planctomycetota bacterium]